MPAHVPGIVSKNAGLADDTWNVNAQMMDEFYETFDVKEGDGMYVKPEERLNTWGK